MLPARCLRHRCSARRHSLLAPRSAISDKVHHIPILCNHNVARSVLSEGMLNHWAGSAPSGRINPSAIEAPRAVGVDTSTCRSKGWYEAGLDAQAGAEGRHGAR